MEPLSGAFDARRMATGEPGVPRRFVWRGDEYVVAHVLEKWKTAGDCRSGSGEQYVRKHWFRIRTTAGHVMELYFERQARSARERKARWWLYAMSSAGGD